MIPVNYKIVPDLLYYTNQYVVDSVANKYQIPFPPSFDITKLGDNKSFIRLLFDENWPRDFTSYRYLFRYESCMNSAASSISSRMRLYPERSELYVCDSDSTAVCNLNIFDLKEDDITMLDLLLLYRIDSTAVNISSIVYADLSTVLSKLIYIYLVFKLTRDYSLFDVETPLSDSSMILEGFYESYLVDIIFIYISGLGLSQQ
jgi:hypothetical protein